MYEPSCRRPEFLADTCHLFEEAVAGAGGAVAVNVAVNVAVDPC